MNNGHKRRIQFSKGVINVSRKGAIRASKHGNLGVYWFNSVDAAAKWINAAGFAASDKAALDEKYAKWLYGANK